MRHHLAMAVVMTGLGVALAADECAVEGSVALPKDDASLPATSAGRYQAAAKRVAARGPRQAVVYLEGDFPAAATAATAPTAKIEQRGFQFVPAILPVRKGARVEFPNLDEEYHNVLSYSRVKEFDLGRYRKDEKPPAVVFEKPGLVELNCEIHEHMRAYILVLETPHFTTTDAEGRFRLEHLPAGKYLLKAWLGPKTVWQQPVELVAGKTAQVRLSGP